MEYEDQLKNALRYIQHDEVLSGNVTVKKVCHGFVCLFIVIHFNFMDSYSTVLHRRDMV